MNPILIDSVLCAIGLGLHFTTKWSEHRRDVALVGFGEFVKGKPAITAVSLLSTLGAFIGAVALDWMNPGMAFACGYVGNSMAVKMVKAYQ